MIGYQSSVERQQAPSKKSLDLSVCCLLVQATPALRLQPEMSAGSAGAAAVLADWGRPTSAVDSSLTQAGAQTQAPGVPLTHKGVCQTCYLRFERPLADLIGSPLHQGVSGRFRFHVSCQNIHTS